MDKSDLEAWGEQLAGEVGAEVRLGRSKKWRCPADLRSRIISYAKVCGEQGRPFGEIAARLGLIESTLARWLRRERYSARAGFRPAAIVRADEPPGYSGEPSLRLITPHGYRVEGLDAETLAYLLQVLR